MVACGKIPIPTIIRAVMPKKKKLNVSFTFQDNFNVLECVN